MSDTPKNYLDIELSNIERVALYAVYSYRLVSPTTPFLIGRAMYARYMINADTYQHLIDYGFVTAAVVFTLSSDAMKDHPLMVDVFAPNTSLEVYGYTLTDKGENWLQASGMLVQNQLHLEAMLQVREVILHPENFTPVREMGLDEEDFDDTNFEDDDWDEDDLDDFDYGFEDDDIDNNADDDYEY